MASMPLSTVSSPASHAAKGSSSASCAKLPIEVITISHSSLKVLSPDLPTGDFPRAALSYRDALRYLRGEALVLPADTPRGMVTVTYRGIPLGPMKNIGSRANNLYPKPWRIKTTHLPEKPPAILEQIAKS